MKDNIIKGLQDPQRVSLLRRCGAYLVDAYIVMMLCSAPILYFRSLTSQGMDTKISLQGFTVYQSLVFVCIGGVLSFLYLVIMPKKTGQTLGKRLMKIKIISLTKKQLSYKQLFIRSMIGMILIEGILFTSSLLLQEFMVQIVHIDSQIFNVYFIVVGISILYSFFNRDQRMLHDCLAQTKIIRVN